MLNQLFMFLFLYFTAKQVFVDENPHLDTNYDDDDDDDCYDCYYN